MFEDIEQLFDEVSSKNNTNNIGKNILVNPSTIPSSTSSSANSTTNIIASNNSDNNIAPSFNNSNVSKNSIKVPNVFNTVPSFDNGISMDKPTVEDNKAKASNGLESIDKMFDSLTNDVSGATDFITKVIDQKDELNKEIKKFNDDKISFAKEKMDFQKYVDLQTSKLDQEKKSFEE